MDIADAADRMLLGEGTEDDWRGAAEFVGATLGGAAAARGVSAASRVVRGGRGSGCPGCPCFLAGTRVATPVGPVAIELLRTGDLVFGYDEATAEVRIVEVLAGLTGQTARVVTVVVSDGQDTESEIEATGEHPFWVVGHGWVAAASLQEGDLLFDGIRGSSRVSHIAEESRSVRTHNLTVAVVSNYFVVTTDGDWLLVHNQDPATVIVYLRTDPSTGEEYVGRADSMRQFNDRQSRHTRRRGRNFIWAILERDIPLSRLAAAEETWTRVGGGPGDHGGRLGNAIWPIGDDADYRRAGGTVASPEGVGPERRLRGPEAASFGRNCP